MDITQTVMTMISPDANQEQVRVVIELASSAILDRFRRYEPSATELPAEADYIVVEVAIARYNRIASEGLTSESVEGDSATYESDLTAKYDYQLRELAEAGSSLSKLGRIKAL